VRSCSEMGGKETQDSTTTKRGWASKMQIESEIFLFTASTVHCKVHTNMRSPYEVLFSAGHPSGWRNCTCPVLLSGVAGTLDKVVNVDVDALQHTELTWVYRWERRMDTRLLLTNAVEASVMSLGSSSLRWSGADFGRGQAGYMFQPEVETSSSLRVA
jgi:hypothetical protein